MKLLLINPRGSNFYAKLGLQIPPLGLAYIAAVVRKKGHKVKIIDLGIESTLAPSILNWPDIVGISADTPRYPEALSVAKTAKEAGKTVVLGGYHVTFLDREALATGLVDFIVRGEGEEIFSNLLNTLENNGDLSDVAGISFMEAGIYKRNKDLLPPENLDEMPFPARDLIPLKSYNTRMNGWPFTSLITSRGCPFNCYFCSSSKFGGLRWRARSAKSIVDEIEHLYKTYGYKAFAFMDDNFTLSPRRVFEFATELERRGLGNIIHWWCFSRVDTLVKNEDMVRRMAETGAYMIFLGLESNDAVTLESYNKHIGNDQQQKAIELLKKYGIQIHASYIIGDIKETRAMVENTIRWASQVKAKSNQFSILTPYPGTVLYDDIQKGNRFLHKEWELFDGLFPVIKLDHLNPAQTIKLLIKAYRVLYLNTSVIFNFPSGRNSSINRKNIPTKSITERIKIIYKAFSILVMLLFKLKKTSAYQRVQIRL